MTSWALIATFDSASTLRHTLDSVIKTVDMVHILDGAWKGWPSEESVSTDGTDELVRLYQDKHHDRIIYGIMHDRPTEIEARTRLLGQCSPGDIFLVIDSDEAARGDLAAGLKRAEQSQVDCFRVAVFQPWKRGPSRAAIAHPRLFKYRKGMRYDGNHWSIVDAAGRRYDQDTANIMLDEFILLHRQNQRPSSYLDQRMAYNAQMRAKHWVERSQTPRR